MSQSGNAGSGGGGGGGALNLLQGNTGGSIGPDGSGTIFVVGAGSVSVSGNAGTNTLTITNGSPSWISISSSQVLTVNTGYFCVSPGGALVLTLPSTSSQGDQIQIALDGATSFRIAQSAGQSIVYGNQTTTVGVGGSLMNTQQGDTITLVCRTPNLRFVAISSLGNLTVI